MFVAIGLRQRIFGTGPENCRTPGPSFGPEANQAMTEQELIALLEKIQALHARAGTDGERRAAAAARERILNRLDGVLDDVQDEHVRAEPEAEYRLTVHDPWGRKLLRALLRRHGVQPYRYPRQRRTTIMVRASERFIDEELWPEFTALQAELRTYLEQATDRIIAAAVHADSTEAEEVPEAARLAP